MGREREGEGEGEGEGGIEYKEGRVGARFLKRFDNVAGKLVWKIQKTKQKKREVESANVSPSTAGTTETKYNGGEEGERNGGEKEERSNKVIYMKKVYNVF